MRYAYPCRIQRNEIEAEYLVSFPDVPEALTSGRDFPEAVEMAGDALVAALCTYVERRLAVPVPSAVMDGQEVVAVHPVAAAKLELYSAMRVQRLTKRALAERLGVSESTVGRLTDPDHRSHIDLVVNALREIGRGLVVEGRAA